MDVQEIADTIVAMFKAGRYDEVGDTYWSPDVVSVEGMAPPGMDPASRGIDAVWAKAKWFYENNELTPGEVDGPFVNGDQFAVHLTSTVKFKSTGQVFPMAEVALYTLKDGKIVEERFLQKR